MDDDRTWRRDSGLVGWNYRPMARSDGGLIRLDLQEPDVRKRWLCELVGRLPGLLGDFAYLTEVRVGTEGKGDGACVIDWRDKDGPPTLLAFLQQAQTYKVYASLNLTCLDRNLEPMELRQGAALWINIALTDSGALDLTEEAPVYLRLTIDTDIYAPWTVGEIQNNVLLAALNGPRLAGFLERIERDVPAQLLDITQDHHPPGTVGPRGFIAPKGLTPDA